MKLTKKMRENLRLLRAGKVDPGGADGQAMLKEALEHDHGLTLKACPSIPKEAMAKAMKGVGFNSAEIGYSLFPSDMAGREAFFSAERLRATRIGEPGFDRDGDPVGDEAKDPFDTPSPAIEAQDKGIDRYDDPLDDTDEELPEYLDPAARMRTLRPR